MTRAEEIKKQANKSADKYADSIGEWSHHRMGFINGAEWADRTLLERACEWLLEWETHQGEDIEVVKQFKHAMKGK